MIKIHKSILYENVYIGQNGQIDKNQLKPNPRELLMSASHSNLDDVLSMSMHWGPRATPMQVIIRKVSLFGQPPIF